MSGGRGISSLWKFSHLVWDANARMRDGYFEAKRHGQGWLAGLLVMMLEKLSLHSAQNFAIRTVASEIGIWRCVSIAVVIIACSGVILACWHKAATAGDGGDLGYGTSTERCNAAYKNWNNPTSRITEEAFGYASEAPTDDETNLPELVAIILCYKTPQDSSAIYNLSGFTARLPSAPARML
ncbi:hypothetical protein BKA66DRAFT_443375 [Pyrenochaeta sp. MPI-SDFR-AT-0127]|nr:hypothetical protein BKA66DRAFT_443375 [Pyrenochaeta sp. MPI-SDFR-AT-0127]